METTFDRPSQSRLKTHQASDHLLITFRASLGEHSSVLFKIAMIWGTMITALWLFMPKSYVHTSIVLFFYAISFILYRNMRRKMKIKIYPDGLQGGVVRHMGAHDSSLQYLSFKNMAFKDIQNVSIIEHESGYFYVGVQVQHATWNISGLVPQPLALEVFYAINTPWHQFMTPIHPTLT